MEFKAIDLLGKPLFKWVTIKPPIQIPANMPDNEACFIYVLQGECINYSETDEIKTAANQALLSKCGSNSFKALSMEGSAEYSAISIHFHKDVLEKIYDKSVPPFFKNKQSQVQVNTTSVDATELIKQYVDSVMYYFEHQGLLSDDILILKLKEIILLLLQSENAPRVLEIMNNLFKKKTFTFKEIIEAHICSSINIEGLAQLNNQSLSSFKKEFRRIYNDTPNNYIIQKRVEKVAHLLLISDETISNIAYDCEFKSIAHLSRIFKTKYGVTPTKYRLNLSVK
ncbi:MAG: AraC family transcriptional regulator [Bacteroidetes bacterium]|nr:MAG: AraC family transcriptional regulator [Bacteroidota bacterium]